MLSKSLNIREKKLADTFLTTHNKQEAAIAAGYSVNGAKVRGFEVLERPHVKEYVEARIKKMTDKFEATFENKIELLWEIANDKNAPAPDRIRAISELNKMQGHLSAEKHVNFNMGMDATLEEVKMLVDTLLIEHRKSY